MSKQLKKWAEISNKLNCSDESCQIKNRRVKNYATEDNSPICTISGCNTTARSQGLCQKHGANVRKCKVEGFIKKGKGGL